MILPIVLISLLPSAPLTSTFVVVANAPEAIVDQATLRDELGARLPELELNFATTPIPGAAFTLVYKVDTSAPQPPLSKVALKLVLSNAAGTQLVNRTLTIQSGEVSDIRELAVFIEGVIRRQADSLADMVAAHAPKPEPPLPLVAPPKPLLQADLSISLGSLLSAGRSTLGGRSAIHWNEPKFLSPSLELSFQTTGSIENGVESLVTREWTIGPMLTQPLHTGDVDLSLVAGPAITFISAESQSLDEAFTTEPKRHFTFRLGGYGEWKLSNDISTIANFRVDFTAQPSTYALRGIELLDRGPILISFGVGLRFGIPIPN